MPPICQKEKRIHSSRGLRPSRTKALFARLPAALRRLQQLRRFRETPTASHLPILTLASLAMRGERAVVCRIPGTPPLAAPMHSGYLLQRLGYINQLPIYA
jgi:hypothetical protein